MYNISLLDTDISLLGKWATSCPLYIAVYTNITDAGGCRDLRKIDMSYCQKTGFDAISAM